VPAAAAAAVATAVATAGSACFAEAVPVVLEIDRRSCAADRREASAQAYMGILRDWIQSLDMAADESELATAGAGMAERGARACRSTSDESREVGRSPLEMEMVADVARDMVDGLQVALADGSRSCLIARA